LAYVVRLDISGAAATAEGRESETYRRWSVNLYLPGLPIFVLGKLLVFGRLKLFRSGWKYTSIRDVTNVLFASWWFLLIMFVLVQAVRRVPALESVAPASISGIPTGVMLLDFMATVFFVCAARLGFRIHREELRPMPDNGVQNVLIVGAGNTAETVIREIFRMSVEQYRVVGMVDDDPVKKGLFIHGIPGEKLKVEEINIAIPSATQEQLRRVIDLCSGMRLKFQLFPDITDLITGRVSVDPRCV